MNPHSNPLKEPTSKPRFGCWRHLLSGARPLSDVTLCWFDTFLYCTILYDIYIYMYYILCTVYTIYYIYTIYSTILYYTILYYTRLCCTILYYILVFHIVVVQFRNLILYVIAQAQGA